MLENLVTLLVKFEEKLSRFVCWILVGDVSENITVACLLLRDL